jgi:hypothetical protein
VIKVPHVGNLCYTARYKNILHTRQEIILFAIGRIIVLKEINLTVNDITIKLENFTETYVEQVTMGMLRSLKGVSEIEKVKVSIDQTGKVLVVLNNADFPLKEFAQKIIRSTYIGLLAPLKGVDKDKPLKNLELNITR